jgi:peptidyl-tRNA hydrolase, PTH1 family
MPPAVLAALGNPGADYAATRHNAGWLVLDALAEKLGAAWRAESRYPALVAKVDLAGKTAHLVKPLVFMNETGKPLAAFLRFHRIEPALCAVLHDDIAFGPGTLRITVGGSDGGHNGVRSCIEHLGPAFIRARVGIGPKRHPRQDLADHVLGRLPPEDLATLERAYPDFTHGLQTLLSQGLAAAQNLTNTRR